VAARARQGAEPESPFQPPFQPFYQPPFQSPFPPFLPHLHRPRRRHNRLDCQHPLRPGGGAFARAQGRLRGRRRVRTGTRLRIGQCGDPRATVDQRRQETMGQPGVAARALVPPSPPRATLRPSPGPTPRGTPCTPRTPCRTGRRPSTSTPPAPRRTSHTAGPGRRARGRGVRMHLGPFAWVPFFCSTRGWAGPRAARRWELSPRSAGGQGGPHLRALGAVVAVGGVGLQLRQEARHELGLRLGFVVGVGAGSGVNGA
jgi:hypothetical protein